MLLFVKMGGKWETYTYTITTTPGKEILGDYMYNSSGTSTLAFPQLAKDAYTVGLHRGYEAMKQTGMIYCWQDSNQNDIADNDSEKYVQLFKSGAGSAINIHRANKSGTSSTISAEYGPESTAEGKGSTVYYEDADGNIVQKFVNLYSYSAGCQVFASATDFQKFLAYMKKDRDTNGTTKWDYIMLLKNDYNNIVADKDIKEYLEKRDKYYKQLLSA